MPVDLSLADLKRIREWASVASSPQYRWTTADKQLLARVERAISAEPEDLGCPTCGAPPGTACTTPMGKVRSDHSAREWKRWSSE